MAGYHLKKIKKGKLGELSKIREELPESCECLFLAKNNFKNLNGFNTKSEYLSLINLNSIGLKIINGKTYEHK